MKVNKYFDKKIEENYIDIYYNKIDSKIDNLFTYLSQNKKIIGRIDQNEIIIDPSDVYYFEIVDRKCFAYMHTKTYLIDWSLHDIIDEYSINGFIRVSKSMIINIYKIQEIKSELNMRINAILDNGETIIVNRNYKKDFYKKIRELFDRSSFNEANK